MFKTGLPLLSTHNGPSYLLHAVETLNALGVPAANVRVVPVIGLCASSEIEPYYQQSNIMEAWTPDHVRRHPIQKSVVIAPRAGTNDRPRRIAILRPAAGIESPQIDARQLFIHLGVNVRADNRLRRFLPVVAVGMVSPAEAAAWKASNLSAGRGYRGVYARLNEFAPEWTNNETPSERLARQLCARFPGMREPGIHFEASADQILFVRSGKWKQRTNVYARSETGRHIESETPFLSAQALVEFFLTQAMLFVATADMMGGFEYELPVEPQGREIDVLVKPDATVRDVVKWLQAYPHYPLPAVRYAEMDERERTEWEAYFACTGHDNIFALAPKLWTEEDPAIVALHGDVRREYANRAVSEASRQEPLTTDEMLSLVRRHLPDYVPRYPRQFAVTGGMNLEGLLINLMEHWRGKGPFLGVATADWQLFAPDQQFMLCSLLMQRRSVLDQSALFQVAVRVLVDASIEMETVLEQYQLTPVKLAKLREQEPLSSAPRTASQIAKSKQPAALTAQLNRTLSLNGVVALHAPEMILKIPMDRVRDVRARDIERKLNIIARLFLPLHIPLKTIWQVDRPMLGKSAHLRRAGEPDRAGPATRLK